MFKSLFTTTLVLALTGANAQFGMSTWKASDWVDFAVGSFYGTYSGYMQIDNSCFGATWTFTEYVNDLAYNSKERYQWENFSTVQWAYLQTFAIAPTAIKACYDQEVTGVFAGITESPVLLNQGILPNALSIGSIVYSLAGLVTPNGYGHNAFWVGKFITKAFSTLFFLVAY